MNEFIRNPNEIVSSGNFEIDSVLNYMLQQAKEKLHTVDVKVQIPEKLHHTFDINVLLCNLLENAMEAAIRTEEKLLSVSIQLKYGILVIEIRNSYKNKLIPDNRDGNLRTTKKSGEHGIGLMNVREVVEKYNGDIKVETQNELFCVKVLLYVDE